MARAPATLAALVGCRQQDHAARHPRTRDRRGRRPAASSGAWHASGPGLPRRSASTPLEQFDRTIASGEAYAEGFAPDCHQLVEHIPVGDADPIFGPLRAGVTQCDAAAAIASIKRETGGMDALVRRHRSALALLERTLACTPVASNCLPATPAAITAGAEGEGISLSGPVRTSSGIAQVLLLA